MALDKIVEAREATDRKRHKLPLRLRIAYALGFRRRDDELDLAKNVERLLVRRRRFPPLTTHADMLEYCRVEFGAELVERLACLHFDSRMELISIGYHSSFMIGSIPVRVGAVVQDALNEGASVLVLVHNHASHDLSPSPQDIETTSLLHTACRLVGIRLAEHVITDGKSIVSFRLLGLM